jgi:hypothetical protein
LSWTGLTGGDYQIRCRYLVPATNAVNIKLQFNEDSGPTWETSGYNWQSAAWQDETATAAANNTNDSGFSLGFGSTSGTSMSSSADWGWTASVDLYALSTSGVSHYERRRCFLQWQLPPSGLDVGLLHGDTNRMD